ncbi:MAG: MFS transporter [Acidimicrobiales bacterium]
MDRRRLLLVFAGLPWPPAASGPLRPQGGAPGRARALRPHVGGGGHERLGRAADRGPGPHGHRGGAGVPGHPRHPQHVHGPSERAKAIGVWSAVSGLAVALGPLTGGFLLEHFWWGSVFLVNVPIAAIAILAGRPLLPTSRDHHAGRPDPVGIVTSIAMITLLVWTVIEAPRHGWTSTRTLAGFAGSAALLVAFVLWEARRPDPMLDVSVFRNARFSAASFSVATAFFGLFGFIFLVTQYFQVVRGYDTLSAGVHTLPFAVSTAIVAPIAARLALRIGTKVVVAAGLLSMTGGFLLASGLDATSPYWTVVVPSMVLMAAGLGLTMAPATEAIMGSLPLDKAGVGSAVNDTTREVGGTLGVAVVGSVFSSLYGPRIAERFTAIGVPAQYTAMARESVVAAAEVARQAPEAVRPTLAQAASDAFLHGMAAGCRAAAVATFVGAAVALALLPARAAAPATSGDDAADPVDQGAGWLPEGAGV